MAKPEVCLKIMKWLCCEQCRKFDCKLKVCFFQQKLEFFDFDSRKKSKTRLIVWTEKTKNKVI